MTANTGTTGTTGQTDIREFGHELWNYLTGKQAVIEYTFQDMTVEVPKTTGPDAPRRNGFEASSFFRFVHNRSYGCLPGFQAADNRSAGSAAVERRGFRPRDSSHPFGQLFCLSWAG